MRGNKLLKEPFLVFGAIFTVTTLVLAGILISQLTGEKNTVGNDVNTNIGIIDATEEVIDYTLRETATDYQKEIYTELLDSQKFFEEEWTEKTEIAYATAIVKNFIADFFTWSNKSGRNDVGGLQFIYPLYRQDFRNQAVDYFYLYLDHYIDEFESNNLLTVDKVDVLGVDPYYVYEMPDGTQKDATYVYAKWDYADSDKLDLTQFPQETGFVLVERENQLVLIEIQ